ncbi:hypothetical protein [Leyella stercorea]|jgi:hypothetical protein|uniref:hypothetical protein n=1 Tax=Leyella stercorea TaxID=363265 RepID=UPI003520488C
MKKYFKGLGDAVVCAPFVIIGIFFLATGMVCKAAGYALFGLFGNAAEEMKKVKQL